MNLNFLTPRPIWLRDENNILHNASLATSIGFVARERSFITYAPPLFDLQISFVTGAQETLLSQVREEVANRFEPLLMAHIERGDGKIIDLSLLLRAVEVSLASDESQLKGRGTPFYAESSP